MRHKLLETNDGRRKFVLVLDAGEEAIAAITAFAVEQKLQGTSLTGIGAFASCSFGHFNPATKEFRRNDLADQSEVLAITGNIAGGTDGAPHLHIHCVVGLNDATTRGGHLIEGRVRPTLELVLEESPEHLQRGLDHASGLVLLQPNQGA